MLSKLLKYEFKAMGRTLLPIYGAAIIMSIVAAISVRFNDGIYSLNVVDNAPSQSVEVFSSLALIISLMLFGGLICAAMVMCITFSVSRFQKNILGKEGYLMNTLPVTAFENVSAKLITATVFQILAVIMIFLSMFFFGMIAGEVDVAEAFRDAADFLGLLSSRTVLTIVLIIINSIIATVCFNALVYASLAVGHSFNGAKMLKSVGVFLLISIAVSFVNAAIGQFGSLFDNAVSVSYDTAFNLSLILSAVRSIAYTALYCWLSQYFIKNRLNLE